MAGRWELGPVFDIEVKINARRWQIYAGRAAFVLTLLAGMTTIWWSKPHANTAGLRAQANLGAAYFYAMIGVQLALTMIVAPAATAGAVCVERARGSLAHMLVTDLTRREIVLGKLRARLLPTVALIACAWPVAALGSLLGGINPNDLTMAFAITLAVGLLGCSMALALSAWAKTVHEVLMAVYTFWGVVLLAYPICFSLTFSLGWSLARRWMLSANPFWLAFAPYNEPGKNGPWEYGGFFGVSIGLSIICIALAMLGVRHNPLGEVRPKRKMPGRLSTLGRVIRLLPGPSLDGNPVFWREWSRGRVSRPLKLLMAALLIASGSACIHGTYEILTQGLTPRMGFAGVMATLAQVLFGLLLLGVLASLTFTEERRRGSLDVLLATPLSTRSIVWGKWLGAYRVVPLLAIGPALILGAFALDDFSRFIASRPVASRGYFEHLGPWGRAFGAALMPITILAHGAWVTSLGLALSVWIRRESRAISLAVAIYAVYVIVLPVLVINLTGPGNNGPFGVIGWYLASSPCLATVQLVEALSRRTVDTLSVLIWIALWDIVALVAASFLIEATVRSFDRCFDRMPENPLFSPRGDEISQVFKKQKGWAGFETPAQPIDSHVSVAD